jgi:hypothetical protein
MTTLFEFPTESIADKFYYEVTKDGIFERISSIKKKVSIIAVNDEQVLRLAKYKTLASRYYSGSFKDITPALCV